MRWYHGISLEKFAEVWPQGMILLDGRCYQSLSALYGSWNKTTMFCKILRRHRIWIILKFDCDGPTLDESLVGISSFPKFFRLLNCEHFFQRSPQVQTKHWNKYASACVLLSIWLRTWCKTKPLNMSSKKRYIELPLSTQDVGKCSLPRIRVPRSLTGTAIQPWSKLSFDQCLGCHSSLNFTSEAIVKW